MANLRDENDNYCDDVDELDLDCLGYQLELLWDYTDRYDPAGSDLIVPVSVLSEVLSWMVPACGNPDFTMSQTDILRRMAYAFDFTLGAYYGELPQSVETKVEEARTALAALEGACRLQCLN